MEFHIHHRITFEHGGEDSKLLRQILKELGVLGEKMSKQDDSIKVLSDAFEGFKTDVSASLDNIAADEAGILAKLNALDGLTPENQAKVDSIVADFAVMSAKVKTLADSIPDVTNQP